MQVTNDKGKSPLDVASYNKVIANMYREVGAVNVAQKPPEWRKPPPDDHHWNRKRYR